MFETMMSAARFSWDAPYRIMASLLAIGCACVLFSWVPASSPLDAIGHVGTYLGMGQADNVTGAVSQWLTTRKDVIQPVASIVLFAGLASNVGDGSGRSSIPGPWRGAPTALLALSVVWEVDPGAVPGYLVTGLIAAVGALIVSGIIPATRVGIQWWLGSTLVNLLGSALYVAGLPIWLLARSSGPKRNEPEDATG
ncbi:hypothetical protein AB0N24_23400 [Arthrobacter sp. NPDC093128]|uniref:hypothetical protein n=1 Tax=Arthrobacter sp. NPDC093128 TaxID=3154979 RepID=UPI003425E447